MGDCNYVISIVIPTKNRQEYAIKTIEQILLVPDSDIQVVVQDNSDSNKLEKMLNSLMNDTRLKYNYSPGILSFVDNFGIAVSNAEGEYVCIIGDDDGINHEIIEICRWAKSKNINAIKPTINSIYIWPNAGILTHDEKANSGLMTISRISTNVKFANTDTELKKLLRNGCQNYLGLEMVKLYHGVVRRQEIERVKLVTGKYFGGLSPDIYGAVSLSIIIPNVLCIDYPLTISGICKKSGSADSVTGKHTGSYLEAPHLKGHANYNWADEVPKFYSVETIWADSALAAIKDMGHQFKIDDFREDVLAAYCISNHREYTSLIKKHYFSRMNKVNIPNHKAFLNLCKGFLIGPLFGFWNRVKNKLMRQKSDVIKLYGIVDIVQSQDELLKYLKENHLSIKNVINKIEIEINNKIHQ